MPAPWEITVAEFSHRLQKEPLLLLDVREPSEYSIANLGGRLIPLAELPHRYGELEPTSEIVVLCHHGVRSARAVEFLRKVGFEKVKNLVGGIDRWSVLIDPTIKRY